MQQYILQTPRLILRPLTAADAEEVFIWCSDPLVNRFMPYALYTKTEDVRRWLETVEKNEKQYEFGFVCKENNRLIGSGGIGRRKTIHSGKLATTSVLTAGTRAMPRRRQKL